MLHLQVFAVLCEEGEGLAGVRNVLLVILPMDAALSLKPLASFRSIRGKRPYLQ